MPKGYACNLAKNTPEIKKVNVDEQRSTNLKIYQQYTITLAISKGRHKMNTAEKQKVGDDANGTFNKQQGCIFHEKINTVLKAEKKILLGFESTQKKS